MEQLEEAKTKKKEEKMKLKKEINYCIRQIIKHLPF